MDHLVRLLARAPHIDKLVIFFPMLPAGSKGQDPASPDYERLVKVLEKNEWTKLHVKGAALPYFPRLWALHKLVSFTKRFKWYGGSASLSACLQNNPSLTSSKGSWRPDSLWRLRVPGKRFECSKIQSRPTGQPHL